VVSAATAKRPEQIGMFVGGRTDDTALGGHHLGGQQVVDGEPVLAHEKADASTEREPGNAGVAHDAASGGQTVGLRLVVDVAPQRAALHQGRAADRVDPHGPHRRQVDDDAVVTYGGTGHVVTTAADGDPQVVVSGETHCHSRVGGPAASSDQPGTPVDGAVPDGSGGVVVGVVSDDQSAPEPFDLHRVYLLVSRLIAPPRTAAVKSKIWTFQPKSGLR
jgi:hypothetical protein